MTIPSVKDVHFNPPRTPGVLAIGGGKVVAWADLSSQEAIWRRAATIGFGKPDERWIGLKLELARHLYQYTTSRQVSGT